MQSQDSVVELLPALPSLLASGSVKGICARGGFVLDMRWSGGVLQRVDVLSRAGGTGVFKYGDKVITVKTGKGRRYRFDGQLKAIL
ncbi:glycoside hydrolase family 95-like protein [Puia sp. P3]|uniref:glycoside hydrolase family 95-like protein n=1 Tax=Puia sp. P3 TaxID=3423952 RepID=UPI003D673586